MKRTFTILMSIMFATSVFAQFAQYPKNNYQLGKTPYGVSKQLNLNNINYQNTSKGISKSNTHVREYNYPAVMNYIHGGSAYNFMWLFPDTIIRMKYSNGLGGTVTGTPQYHAILTMFNPRSIYFNDYVPGEDLYIDNNIATDYGYSVDSIALGIVYTRVTSAVDTLMVQLFTATFPDATPSNCGYFLGQTASYGVDTVYIQGFGYDTINNGLTGLSGAVTKVPLTNADTVGGVVYKSIVEPFNVIGANKVVGACIWFKPGSSYTATDTLAVTHNVLRVISWEENADTFPTYTKNDWNLSYVYTSESKYNYASGWYDQFLPSYAYTSQFAYENHDITFFLHGESIGINEVEPVNGVKLAQNYPNPFNNTSKVTYSIEKKANVSFEIYDITGKKIQSTEEGIKVAGTYDFNIDASKLSSGVYYYTLIANDTRLTKKMIIVE